MRITFFITKFFIYTVIALVILGICSYAFLGHFTKASNIREWNLDQAILPEIIWGTDNSSVLVKNIRNFSYTSTTEYIPAYYDKMFKLDDLKKVHYIVEPFAGVRGSAHTFLSFEFKNPYAEEPEFLAVSVEIRKEKGESFSALKGLFNQYEIMYVIADEKDVVKLRSNYRKDDVYIYPVKADITKARELLTSVLTKAQTLETVPEFYNTAFNNCTTNIADHVNLVSPNKLEWNKSYILPAYSDKYIYDLGLIDTDLSFEKSREKFRINEKAALYADDPLFSKKIRD